MPALLRIILQDDRFLPVDVSHLLNHRVQLGIPGILIVGFDAEKFFEAPIVGLSCLDLVSRVEDVFPEEDEAEKLTHLKQSVLAILARQGEACDRVFPFVSAIGCEPIFEDEILPSIGSQAKL